MNRAVVPDAAAGDLSAPPFAAFISYAHADAGMAMDLHRRLETYRLPRALRRSGATATLGRIFRDRTDLAAADSLSDAIRDALAGAAALVVLCSPDAASSRWVDAEIRLFRQLHPAAPVLAVIVAGEPATALPPALTEDGREPLAADLRLEGDGRKLGLLKIVAALARVPLDALVRRDAQRRFRRVTAVTLAGATALLIMAAMTVMAINARNEAQRQRAAAEGLVEYMLTDLRQRLRGVGRLDIMDGVNARAMALYTRDSDLSALPDDSLERRARLLHAMGEDDVSRGDLAAAAAKFREAHRATGAVLRRDPTDPDRLFAHAQSEFWIAYIPLARGDTAAARPHIRAYRDLAERLRAVDPDQTRALREIGYAEGNLCTLDLSDRLPAVARCRAALAAMEAVAARLPGDASAQRDVLNRHAYLADALAAADDFAGAVRSRQAQHQLATQMLAADPRNFDVMVEVANAKLALAAAHGAAGRIDTAQGLIDEAAALVRPMIAHDPTNQRWRCLADRIAATTPTHERRNCA